jgi:hypothetical protein
MVRRVNLPKGEKYNARGFTQGFTHLYPNISETTDDLGFLPAFSGLPAGQIDQPFDGW